MALGAIGLITSLAVAVAVRGSLVREEETRFQNRVKTSVGDVRRAIERRAASDKAALDRTCQVDPIVDRAVTAAKAREDVERLSIGDPDLGRLEVVAAQARAMVAAGGVTLAAILGADEVWIVDDRDGFVYAAPTWARSSVGARDPRRLRLARDKETAVRRGDAALLVARCLREEHGEKVIVSALHKLDRAFLDHVADEVRGVRILAPGELPRPDEIVQKFTLPTAPSDDQDGVSEPLELAVGIPATALASAIARINQVILVATLVSILFGAAVGFLVARRLVSPLGALASEARKVAEGTAAPVEVRGRDEVAELAIAFNGMLESLETTRRQLHAAERVAAWREAARRIAHEIMNPLAPIRASIETLRRLRGREDPAFDGYFDEATTTVLQEVRRVNNIVDEFSRYARIAPPRPKDVDPVEIGKHVVGLFGNVAEEDPVPAGDPTPRLSLVVSPCGTMRADREQLVQVLVNLVKNALEATRPKEGKPAGHVRVEVEPAGPEAVRFVVRDDGPGVDDSLAQRLFEPYATAKQGGTGLGLAIAQRIAVEHGGAIAYARAPTGGAVFRLILPRRGPQEAPADVSVTPRPRQSSEEKVEEKGGA